MNLFSVLSSNSNPSIKNRVVVEHTGTDDGNGEWKCCKDSKAIDCLHIVDARDTLQKYLQGNPNATDPNAKHPQGMLGLLLYLFIALITVIRYTGH